MTETSDGKYAAGASIISTKILMMDGCVRIREAITAPTGRNGVMDVMSGKKDDLIRREDAIKAVLGITMYEARVPIDTVIFKIKDIPSAENKGEWIPIKWHEITDKEREEEGYPEGWSVFIDSVKPNDGERILVTTKHGEVEIDTCYEDDGFYLDSGWDWVDDIIAWMPLPEPWEGEGE